jgi:putative inorganic carbon (HCO3(-)) transporter
MQSRLAERACVLALLAYLVWLPMPFGSVVDAAQPPLILAPLIICAAAALLRSRATNVARPTAPYRIWTTGAVVFALIAAFQLVELPDGLLRVLSPESFAIWSAASRVSALLLQSAPPAEHPITVDPAATWLQLFRFLAYVATFQASAILIRNHLRRIALAATLGATALFEVLYGVREAALQRYAIWGWKNTKIYNRVTGTFVNPNHFAHYAAIVLPIGVYLAALAWREAAPSGVPVRRRLARLVEKRFLMFAGGATVSLACIVAILVAQSRGALLAIAAGFAAAGALSLRPSHHRRHSRGVAFAKFALAFAATALVVGGLIALLGTERTVARFKPTETEQTNFVGRRDEIAAAVAVWKRFPLFGSGLGTFEHVVTLVQSKDLHVTYNHAHDDYAEIAATTGLAGFSVAIVAIVLGYVALVRLSRARSMSSRRRGFLIAALCSILVALVHALIDFNFFIPANPATLAAIAGAAVATRSVRDAESGSASSDSRVAAPPGALPPES